MTSNPMPHAQKPDRHVGAAVLTAPENLPAAVLEPGGLPAFPLLDCAEFQRVLSEVVDREHLPASGLVHLSDCDACTMMLEDFEAIAGQVRGLPLFHDPGPDQWPQIRDALLREGLIHNGTGCPPAARAEAAKGTKGEDATPRPRLVRSRAPRNKTRK